MGKNMTVALLILMAGCVSLGKYPQCYLLPKNGIKACVVSPRDVAGACRNVRYNDDGTMAMNPIELLGCADRSAKIIFLSWEAPEPETAIHEMAHMLGERDVDVVKIR